MKGIGCISLLILNLMTFRSEGTSLTVEIKGLDSKKGTIHVGLYRKQDQFPEVKGTYKNKIQQAEKSAVTFEDLEEGTYAIAVFHDENKNGKMDRNFLGVPTEKYGFSNNVRGVFSAPGFDEAKFELKSRKKIVITIQ